MHEIGFKLANSSANARQPEETGQNVTMARPRQGEHTRPAAVPFLVVGSGLRANQQDVGPLRRSRGESKVKVWVLASGYEHKTQPHLRSRSR
jgi:hypothetical protein